MSSLLKKDAINDELNFLTQWPEYGKPSEIATLRNTEYRRLDENNEIYVDYTGGGLYGQSQIEEHVKLLSNHVFGNPHSQNPTSHAMTDRVEHARQYVLNFFHADEYVCIFTPNASGALKLVGESYPFSRNSQYTLTYDNHNSVNGIREFAHKGAAKTVYVHMEQGPDLGIDQQDLIRKLRQANQGSSAANNLFAFPAQSNYTGTQHPLELIQLAHKYNHHVLVDFAAYAPTNRIDINKWKPDFAAFSFYKIFGYPTGLGCLLVRKDTMQALNRPWFAGGTVQMASVSGGWHVPELNEAAFEDGTIDYLNIPAIEIGLRTIKKLDLDKIKGRVMALTGYFIENLLKLQHSNGKALVEIFGAHSTNIGRGGTVTFLLSDSNGVPFDEDRVEELANNAHISLRTGCFCNPGAAEAVLLNLQQHPRHTQQIFFRNAAKENTSKSEYKHFLLNEFGVDPSNAIRVSFGLASNFRDVYILLNFLKSFIDTMKTCTTTENVGVGVVGATTTLLNSSSFEQHEIPQEQAALGGCDEKAASSLSQKQRSRHCRRGLLPRMLLSKLASKIKRSHHP